MTKVIMTNSYSHIQCLNNKKHLYLDVVRFSHVHEWLIQEVFIEQWAISLIASGLNLLLYIIDRQLGITEMVDDI